MADAERDPVAMAMLAAWLNVSFDQIPAENRAHLNPSTMAAWKRVADAAVAAHRMAAERAVVEWLRNQPFPANTRLLNEMADAIERGEHLKGTDNG